MFDLLTKIGTVSKKLLSLIVGFAFVAGALVLPASPAAADTRTVSCSTSGNFTIVDHIITTSTGDCSGSLVIPADVIEIGSGSFSRRSIASISFEPASQLTTISNWAFEFTNVASVVLPDGLTTISNGSFTYSTFKTITIPASVQYVAANAFYGSALETVTFAQRTNSNLSISDGAFTKSSNLTALIFQGPTNLHSSPGSINKTDFTWLGWSLSADGPVVTFPLSITNPAGGSLYPRWHQRIVTTVNCSLGGTFLIEEHVVTSSSADCAGQVVIPADVTEIGFASFSHRNITGVTFETGSQLTLINSYGFEATKIANIDLPVGLKHISGGAFTWAPMTSISIPGTVEVIESTAFYDTSLETVTFQPRVANTLQIGNDAFIYTHSLVSVTFAGPIELTNSPFQHTLYANDWLGWSTSLGGAIESFPLSVADSANLTLYPNSSPRTYQAIYDSMGGSEVSATNIIGGRIEFPTAPTKAGYSFAGWYDNDSYANQISRWDHDNDGHFYAKWNPNTNSVHFNSKGGSAVQDASFLTGSDVQGAPDSPTRAGYEFSGWSATDGGEAVSFPYTPGVTNDITLFALWTRLTPHVSQGTTPNSEVARIPAGLDEGTIPATDKLPSIRFVFAGIGGEATATITPTSNPEQSSFTPFIVTNSTKFVDIKLVGVTGSITLCIDGAPTDHLYHYTGGQWVDLPGQSYVNGQVCGVTTSFSPFAAAAPAPFKPRLKARPTISGNAQQNNSLSSTRGTWLADPIASTTQQWYRCDNKVSAGLATLPPKSNCSKIARATKVQYKVVLADQGKYLTMLVTASNRLGSTMSSSNSIRVPLATLPSVKSAPRVAGTVAKGTVVTANVGSWKANPVAAISVQWYRCDTAVAAKLAAFTDTMKCVKVNGATKASYKIVAADQGKFLTALVTAKNSQGVVQASAKSVRVPGTKPTAKSSPKVSGSAKVGTVVRATSGSWSAIPEATTSVQWYRCASAVPAGTTSFTSAMHCQKINGATSAQHTVVPADQGKYLTVLVKAKNVEGSSTAAAHAVFVKVPVTKP